jgi:5-formyltetrahydrofolate cyclo-ligase
MHTKTELRQHLRHLRRSLDTQAQRRASQQLGKQLQRLSAIKKAKHIAAYWPNDGEISPLLFLQQLQAQGKMLYLPEVGPHKQLRFKRFHLWRKLGSNQYGIPEPLGRHYRATQDIDIILMPLVGFDRKGNRLGMGGGYYDRTLAFKKKQLWRKKPLLIGLAHHIQESDALHADSWDIPLNGIATDKGLIQLQTP